MMFHRYFKLVLIILFSCSAFLVSSQPTEDDFIPCHHAGHKLVLNRYKPTEADIQMMENSNKRSDSFDVLNYAIDIDITNYSGKSIKANTIVKFKTKIDQLEWIVLDLKNLSVDSIYFRGKQIQYNYDGEMIIAFFGEPLGMDVEDEIKVYYQGVPHRDPVWGGFYFADNYIYNLGIGLSTTPPNFGKVWFPCFDNFVERTTYDYYVTTTSDKKAFCVGTFMSQDSLGPNTIRRHYRMNTPITTYLSSIAASNYSAAEYQYPGAFRDIPVQLVAKPGDLAKMLEQFEKIGIALDAFEYWFGPYRFERVGYVATTVGAMEHPTNVAYPVGTITSGTLIQNERLYGHELGHHWWGDITTLDDARDMWIKEGTAEYSSHLFIERAYGEDAFRDAVKSNLSNIIFNAHKNDGSYLALSPMPYDQTYGTHTYRKGAAMIHNMRGYLGDDEFRRLSTMVFDSLFGQSMNAYEFRDFLNRNGNKDMTDYFSDYIFNPGYCTFYIDSSALYSKNNLEFIHLEIRQKGHHAGHLYNNVPLILSLYDQDMKRVEINIVASSDQSFFDLELPAGFVPVTWILNEYQNLNLATLQSNSIITRTGSADIPYTGMVVNVSSISDSSYVNIAHHLVGPEDDRKASNIDLISKNHFWQVSTVQHGILEMDGRIEYNGSDSTFLDRDILFKSEDSLILAYRKTPSDPWIEYPDYNKIILSPTDRKGFVRITKLLPGDYALAHGYHRAVANENIKQVQVNTYPNPAQDRIFISGKDSEKIHKLEFITSEGKPALKKTGTAEFDISELKPGHYLLLGFDSQDKLILTDALLKH